MSRMATATQAISTMLYSDPIYKWIPEGEKCLNVFAYGEDEYTFEFLDQCLQIGQMLHHQLNITVLVDEPETTLKAYLQQKPALKGFININGKTVPEGSVSYGNLHFCRISNTREDEKANIEDMLLHLVADEGNEHFHYVFISTGNDARNSLIANYFTSASKELGIICSVHYVMNKTHDLDENNGIPIYIDTAENPILQEMERMAFNVHLCWKGFHRASLQKEIESFYGSENWESSLLFVASLPYKLYSLNIDISDIREAAKMLDDLLQSHNHDQKLYSLAELEHRRWVIEKICNGWTAPTVQNGRKDYSFCLNSMKNSDPGKRVNTCIVRSTSVFPLESWTEDMWNYEEETLSELDDLDRMSIDLHRMYKGIADALSSGTIESVPEILNLQKIVLKGTTEASNCFDHYCLCIKSIIDGSKGYSKRYYDYRNKLLEIIKKEMPSSQKTVESLLEKITKMVFPAIQRNLFVDYKRMDLDLLRKIPFVLTYSQPENVIISYPDNIDTNSDTLLHCVSSITALRPKRVTYLITVSKETSKELLTGRMESIRRYLNGQFITIPMLLKVAYVTSSSEREESDYKALCSALSYLHKTFPSIGYKVQRCDGDDSTIAFFLSSAHEYINTIVDGSNPFFSSCKQNADFITKLEKDSVPYVEYNLITRSFTQSSNCAFACFIHDESYMQSSDMFALMGAKIISSEYPAYAAIYSKLKGIYLGDLTHLGFKKSVRAWNILVYKMKRAQAGANPKQISFSLTNNELKDNIHFADILAILTELQNAAIISNLSANDLQQRVSFLISNDLYLGIFKNEGSMLEIYTFFEACATGMFDDVNSGLKFSWMNSVAENELDGVLTSGYESLVIECKDRKGRVTEFVHKIDSVAMHFGLGTQKIMVLTRPKEPADIQDKQYLTDLRARCKAMKVHLIIGEEDVRNIGDRLAGLIERK